MIARAAGLLALGLAACGGAAKPPIPPSPGDGCTLRHPAERVDSLKKLPKAVRDALLATAGGMADRGEFFNAGDAVSTPAPFNRFIAAGQIGTRWFVWYEHGGIAYWKQIAVLGADPSSGFIVVRLDARASDADLCALTDKLFDDGL
ncbi:MAG: hypothetical protein WDN08_02315 [Rhizomicrobium sp.]